MVIYASVAVSADGYIDDLTRDRLVLSSAEDWEQVRGLRAECDAILVGAETVRRDNPALVTKGEALIGRRVARGCAADPIKVTVSCSGAIDLKARFFTQGKGRKVVVVGSEAEAEQVEALRQVATVYSCDAAEPTAQEILNCLKQESINALLIEGGSQILTLFLREDRVDYLRLAVAPFFVGESAAPRFVQAGVFPFHKGRRMHLRNVGQAGDMAVLNYALRTDREDEARMRQAIALATACPLSNSAYSVGAVVVTCAGEVFTGYSRESAPNNHAEEEAVMKADKAGASLVGATIYSTMEPCTTRSSKPRSCSALIIEKRFARVVFAAYEPTCFVLCQGEAMLSEAGVEVAVMGALSGEALAVNRHIFEK